MRYPHTRRRKPLLGMLSECTLTKPRGRDIQLVGRPVSVDHIDGNKSPNDERFAVYMISMTFSTAV